MARYYDADAIDERLAYLKESYKCGGSDYMYGSYVAICCFEKSIKVFPTTDDVAIKRDVVAEIIDDLAREGLLNVVPWAIAELKRKYREDINNEN